MLRKLKYNPKLQIPLFIALTFCSAITCYFFDFYPKLRMNFGNFFKALVLVFLISLILGIFYFSLHHFKRDIYERFLKKLKEDYRNSNWWEVSGAALVAGCAEEVFFRAFLFELFYTYYGLFLALIINALITLFLYFQKEERIFYTLNKVIECTMYAFFYNIVRSIFFVAVAHALVEILTYYIVKKSRA